MRKVPRRAFFLLTSPAAKLYKTNSRSSKRGREVTSGGKGSRCETHRDARGGKIRARHGARSKSEAIRGVFRELKGSTSRSPQRRFYTSPQLMFLTLIVFNYLVGVLWQIGVSVKKLRSWFFSAANEFSSDTPGRRANEVSPRKPIVEREREKEREVVTSLIFHR